MKNRYVQIKVDSSVMDGDIKTSMPGLADAIAKRIAKNSN